MDNGQHEGSIKRIACQIFTQLPEDRDEALQVLRYVRGLVRGTGEHWDAEPRLSSVSLFRRPLIGREALRVVCPEGSPDLPDIASRE